MTAKEEFLRHTKGKAKIRCAKISDDYELDNQELDADTTYYILKIGYTQQDLRIFLDSLDFDSDSKTLYGIIWLEDGTWFERAEYDGNTWWEYKSYPEIPSVLKEN